MKKLTAILLICIMTVTAFGVTASAGSYEDYMSRFSSRSTARATNAAMQYYDYFKAEKYISEKIPAIMYHKITDNPAEVTDYVITGDMLIADFNEIRARGYTPIFVSEYYDVLSTFKAGGSEKYTKVAEFFENNPNPIIITFDDGYEGIYTDVLPLMRAYGMKVNFYICGQLIDEQDPEYCTWEQLKELSECEYAQIGNHTYGLHRYSKEQLADLYKYDLYTAIDDINRNRDVIKEKTGVDSTIFSFPYGLYDNYILTVLKSKGYNGFISTDYRSNTIKSYAAALGRFNRPASLTTTEFFDLIKNY